MCNENVVIFEVDQGTPSTSYEEQLKVYSPILRLYSDLYSDIVFAVGGWMVTVTTITRYVSLTCKLAMFTGAPLTVAGS